LKMGDAKLKIVIITGPTATGKSALAIEMAEYLNAEIINADSMQVYRYMNIGTAKVLEKERKGIPHHLIDIVDPDQEFNAAIYRRLAIEKIKEIYERGKRCLIVGGTGLYIRTLLGGLMRLPPGVKRVREKIQKEMEEIGLQGLYQRLKELDPEAAINIHPRDRIRITRALEVIELTRKRFSELVRSHRFSDNLFESLKICLFMDRGALYDRINRRTLKMVEEGLLDETKWLLKHGYGPELKSMQSIGYRHMVRVIQGEWSMDTAIRLIQRDTRRYAKRQITWFKKERNMLWIDVSDKERLRREIEYFYEAL